MYNTWGMGAVCILAHHDAQCWYPAGSAVQLCWCLMMYCGLAGRLPMAAAVVSVIIIIIMLPIKP
jgi:type IV secretory pathway component VirB8